MITAYLRALLERESTGARYKATLACGKWRGHAAHEYVDAVYGPVRCPGRAFDHWPGCVSRIPGS